ncbi:hypothetical protein ACFXK0_22050 [Nocardia sp. NPDC059177]|uniref:hypothetical protein n=1 Tax=Nocardia sp. NPDC059177 TaxID=3346759 RepID=UPI0036A88E43
MGRIGTAAALVAIFLLSSCGLNSEKRAVMAESSHTRGEQCDRAMGFFSKELGISPVDIEYGSGAPNEKIGLGAHCTVTQNYLSIGQTRLRAMLPNESEPALLKGDLSYISQSGYDEKVWIQTTSSAVRIATMVDGWQGTLDIQTAQIKIGESKFKVSDQQVRTASQFLITLTKELGAQS